MNGETSRQTHFADLPFRGKLPGSYLNLTTEKIEEKKGSPAPTAKSLIINKQKSKAKRRHRGGRGERQVCCHKWFRENRTQYARPLSWRGEQYLGSQIDMLFELDRGKKKGQAKGEKERSGSSVITCRENRVRGGGKKRKARIERTASTGMPSWPPAALLRERSRLG